MGIDPLTHKPKAVAFGSAGYHSGNAANLSHMAQWESARLEAEAKARLARDSKLVSNHTLQTQTAQLTNKAAAPPARPHCLDVLKAWQGVIFSMFSAAGGYLGSPTSILNFPESNIAIPAIGAHENSTATIEFPTNNVTCNRGMATEFNRGNDVVCSEKLKEARLDCSMAVLNEMSTYSGHNICFVDSFSALNAPIGNIMDDREISDILFRKIDAQNSFMAEENTNGSCSMWWESRGEQELPE